MDAAALAVPGSSEVVVCLPDPNDPIALELLRGQYELPAAARLVLALVGPGVRLLDLGAHIGTVTLAAAALGADVLAVEASPRNASGLKESVRRNQLARVAVCNVAVGDKRGSVRFREEGPYGRVAASDDTTATVVEMFPAHEIVTERGWDAVDVVKIDVEGYEVRVVDGLRPLLNGPVLPPVVFEANRHVLAAQGVEPSDVVAAFVAQGYDTFLVGDGELLPAGPNAFQPETVADYLAITPGAQAPWPVRAAATDDEIAARIVAEATSHVAPARAALARACTLAPRALLARADVQQALEALALDADDDVAAAAQWWPAWRQARAARAGALAVVADGWRSLAQSAAALHP